MIAFCGRERGVAERESAAIIQSEAKDLKEIVLAAMPQRN
jgi:hypothetical protein